MRTAVVGSRTYPLTKAQSDAMKKENLDDWAKVQQEGRERVYSYVDRIASSGNSLVSGGAKGVDTWAEERAKEIGIDTLILKADWDKYGRGAGFKRNKDIVIASDELIAFWDLVSKGTQDTIAYAIELHKPLIVINPVGLVVFAAGEDDWNDFENLKQRVKMDIPKGS